MEAVADRAGSAPGEPDDCLRDEGTPGERGA